MKFVKWRILLMTSLLCLLPIFLGIAVWDSLPDPIAIHFDIYGEPDSFAPKGFAVFGIPVLMMVLQIFCCITNDISAVKYSEKKDLGRVMKWLNPALSASLYVATIGFSLGYNIDIRKVAAAIAGFLFLVVGGCIFKLDYIKNCDISPEKAKKINQFLGLLMIALGVLMLVSIFLPPIFTVICLFLLIPYAGLAAVCTIKARRKK